MVKASVDDWWPWTEDYIYTGDMERSFLRYLLSADSHIDSVQGEDKIVVMQVRSSCWNLVEIRKSW